MAGRIGGLFGLAVLLFLASTVSAYDYEGGYAPPSAHQMKDTLTAGRYSPALQGRDLAFELGVKNRLKTYLSKEIRQQLSLPVNSIWPPDTDFRLLKTINFEAVDAALVFRQKPTDVTLPWTREEAKLIVKYMVEEMLEQGLDPGRDFIHVTLMVYLPKAGETGKKLAEVYGAARYDPVLDYVYWEDARSRWGRFSTMLIPQQEL